MPAYRSSGSLDDNILTDGDRGFIGIDARMQPHQLEEGMVTMSRNGRIEGYWQPRKAVQLRSGALATSAYPLRLNFFIINSQKIVTSASRNASNEVSLTVTGHGLGSAGTKGYVTLGDVSVSKNPLTGTTPVGVGSYEMEVVDANTLKFANVGGSETFTLNDTAGTYSRSSGSSIATCTFTSHGLSTGQYVYLDFSSGSTDGRYQVTVTGANTFTVVTPENTAQSGVSVTWRSAVLSAQIDDNSVSEIWGSCLYSNPSSTNDEYIILASSSVAKKVDLDTYTVTDIPYPAGLSLNADVNMIQAFDRVYIFRDGQQAWEYTPLGRPIESASQGVSGGAFSSTVNVTVSSHGLTTGDRVTVSGLTYSTGTIPTWAIGNFVVTVTGVDTFTYVTTTSTNIGAYNVANAKIIPDGFTKVLGGPYTQPQTFAVSSSDVNATDGLVTINVTGNTTIKSGDFVVVYETDIQEFTALVGKTFQVVSATATEIEFYAPVGDFTAGGSDSFEFGGRFSQGGGFIHQPGFPWAVYFQRRLWGPYIYEPNGTTSSPTYTNRSVRAELVASDILDGNTFDQIYNQFSITAGIADRIVALHPFTEDKLLVLNRNSLHLVNGTQGGLEDTVVTELTREVGCLARKSVVTYSNAVFFLSDNGIYGLEFLNDYNLRGVQEPLSKPIQPIIDRINKSLSDRSVATYFNNRYWIAVPLDSSVGANDAVGNNVVLVYNVLNKAWESIDTYGTGGSGGVSNGLFGGINGGNLDITDFHVGSSEARNNLYFVNTYGGIHEVDSFDGTQDSLSLDVLGAFETYKVDYEFRTRGYLMGSQDRKKFSVAQVQCQSGSQNSNATFQFETEDPDSEKYEVATINSLISQDLPSNEPANLRMRLGNPRGYYGILTISAFWQGSAPVGRPKINSVVLDATITNRQTISQF